MPTSAVSPISPILRRGSLVALLLLLGAGPERGGPARNAILFVGDGMGVPVVTAARIHAHGPGGRLAMELPHVALVRTFSLDRMVPDSGSTATALFAGERVRFGTVGMHPTTLRACSAPKRPDGSPNPSHPCAESARPIESLADLAIRAGMAVGVVSTTRITHATPASLYAHVDERNREEEIARQLAERADLSFVAGGGRRFFLPGPDDEEGSPTGTHGMEPANGIPPASRTDGRDLLAEMRERGVEVASTREELRRAVEGDADRILGLLADDHLPFEAERVAAGETGPPLLVELTDLAIRHLSRHPGGYLLLVEGGKIDHALHANIARAALEQTLAMDAAVARARELVNETDTLILVTADHGQPVSIAGYPLVDDPILGLARTGGHLDEDMDAQPDYARALDGKGMTVLLFGNGPGHGGLQGPAPPREDPIELGDGILDPLYRQESAVPLLGSTHEGSDVMAAAVGPGSEAVGGFLDQTDLFRVVRHALGL